MAESIEDELMYEIELEWRVLFGPEKNYELLPLYELKLVPSA